MYCHTCMIPLLSVVSVSGSLSPKTEVESGREGEREKERDTIAL